MDFLVASLAMLLLAVQLIHLATFNLQPEQFRLLINALSLLGYGALVLIALFYGGPATVVHLAGLVLFSSAAFISLALHPERTNLSTFIDHVTSPMLLGMLTMRRTPSLGSRGLTLLWLAAVGAAVLGAGLALLGTPYSHAGVERLAIFAGGELGVHPSAYASTCFFLTLFVLWRAKVGLSWLNLLLMAALAYVVFKYQVRTVWLMMAVFAGFGALYWLAQRSMALVIAAAGVAILTGVAILFVVSDSGFDLARFSSGRTLIYAERLQLISSRDPIDLLFGTGSGTDKMRGISAWRWEAKDSHNDLMTAVFELGFVGLLGFLLMIAAPLMAMPPSRRGWIIMIAASSLVSNGVLGRPSIGAPLILIAWLALALRERALERTAQDVGPLEQERQIGPPLAGAYRQS